MKKTMTIALAVIRKYRKNRMHWIFFGRTNMTETRRIMIAASRQVVKSALSKWPMLRTMHCSNVDHVCPRENLFHCRT